MSGQSQSLKYYVLHMTGIFFFVIIIAAMKHWAGVSIPALTVMGCVTMLFVFSIMLLPSLNGPRNIAISSQQVGHVNLMAESVSRKKGQYLSIANSVEDGLNDSGVALTSSDDLCGVEKHRKLEMPRRQVGKLEQVSDSEVEVSPTLNDMEPLASSEPSHMPALPIVFVSFYGRHVPLSQTMCMWRCYGLAVIFMCVAGAGILVINNVQAIAQAVQEEPSAFFVTLLSIANASGRILVGIFADAYLHQISRLQVISVICVLMAAAQFVLSLGSPKALYPSLLLVGIMFGAIFSSMAAVTADIFGAKYVGSNYGYIDLAPAVGSYIFSVGMVALFYPSSHDKMGVQFTEECVGAHCFRYAFWVTCCCCVLCAGLAHIMHMQTPINRS